MKKKNHSLLQHFSHNPRAELLRVAACSVPWKVAWCARELVYFSDGLGWPSERYYLSLQTLSLSALLSTESWDVLFCSCYSGLKTLAKWLCLFLNAGCCLGLYMFPHLKHLFFFFLWHFLAVYSTASLPDSSLGCDLLLPSFLSCWSVCRE